MSTLTVGELQRELLAVCKSGSAYETWAAVSGQPLNERVDIRGRYDKQARVDELRLQIHAINPDAALYFGWCPGEDGPRAKREFFEAITKATP